jgi:ferric-dicitrate binding protein FerR (iron transport regulator)
MTNDPRIDLALEGRLAPAEWSQLQRDILANEELRRQYVEQRWLHVALQAEASTLLEKPISIIQPSAPARAWWPSLAAVAMVALGLVGVWWSGNHEPEIVAILTETENCRWAGSDLPTVEGAGLTAGRLALTEGLATIRFASGATVTLEAPSVLEVQSAMKCLLIEGSVVADVPESAHGFTIDTKHMEVIDLGTRFGVTTTPLGQSNVFVFEGEVKVNQESSPETRHVFAGGSLVGNSAETTDQEASRAAPVPSPGDDWRAIPTSLGRGADAYVRRGDSHGPTGAHPLLMVKHTTLAAKNERRAVLDFDLAGLTPTEVLAAKLTLKSEPSGLGFSSLVPDSRFVIYGVLPEAGSWSEDSLLWENAGPLAADEIDPALARPLGTCTIRKGSPHGFVEFASNELAAFLQERAGQVATFWLVRETDEADKQGLVHAFASREHPTSFAPTLWIQTTTPR